MENYLNFKSNLDYFPSLYEKTYKKSNDIFSNSFEKNYGSPVYDNYGSLSGKLHKSGLGYDYRDNDSSYIKSFKIECPSKSWMNDPYDYNLKKSSIYNSEPTDIFRNSYERKVGLSVYDNMGSYSGRLYQSGTGYDFRDHLGTSMGSMIPMGSSIPWVK